MSYNITAIDTKKCTLTIRAEDARRIMASPDALPTTSQFTSDSEFKWWVENSTDPDAQIPFGAAFKWSGDWSGRGFEKLEREIFPLCLGELDCIAVWEGGDTLERWIVKGGELVTGVVE